MPPLSAQDAGEVEPIRVFDTAEAAMKFLALLSLPPQRTGRRLLPVQRSNLAVLIEAQNLPSPGGFSKCAQIFVNARRRRGR
jgi:hypothetical protein